MNRAGCGICSAIAKVPFVFIGAYGGVGEYYRVFCTAIFYLIAIDSIYQRPNNNGDGYAAAFAAIDRLRGKVAVGAGDIGIYDRRYCAAYTTHGCGVVLYVLAYHYCKWNKDISGAVVGYVIDIRKLGKRVDRYIDSCSIALAESRARASGSYIPGSGAWCAGIRCRCARQRCAPCLYGIPYQTIACGGKRYWRSITKAIFYVCDPG